MVQTASHPQGSFCWIELATTDHDPAKKFYSSLFDWMPNDNPMGPGEVYTIFRMNGRDAAAGYKLRKDQLDRHVPAHWILYIAVNSADDAAARATKLGGSVLVPAFDMMGLGRMAVMQDPTGATFCVWQAKTHAGLGVVGENNSFCWADLSTVDPERAGKFYSELFGWELMKGEKDDYIHIKNGETHIGGIPPAEHRNAKTPAHWLIYFMVADVGASTEKAKQTGARIYMPPRKMEGVGTWSVLADPQGAAFAVFKSGR